MSYLDDHLLDGERIVYRARLHWTIFLKSIVVVLLGAALGILLYLYEPLYWWLGAALAGIGLLLAIGPLINYTSSEFAVTNKRVLSKTGFVERESDETLLSKVEGVSVDQGVLGRMLGFGTVTITGSGGTEDLFPRISEPLEFRRQVQGQVVAFEERRGGPREREPASSAGQPDGPRVSLLCRANPGPCAGLQALRTRRSSGSGVISERLAGSILGQALGDALGFVVEAQPPETARIYVQGWLRAGRAGEWSHPQYPFGQYSDDTQLARELLRSFKDAGGWDPSVFATRLAELFRDRRDVGAGQGTRSAALRLLQGVHWTESGTPAPYAGNGSAMRVAPLGLLFADPDAIGRAAREQSRITHLDLRCAGGAVAVARAASISAVGRPIDAEQFLGDIAVSVGHDDHCFADAIRSITEWLSLNPEAAARRLNASGLDAAHSEWKGISAFVVPSVCWSLYAFLRSPDDYWETICTAIGVGGDTDTMAAMAGAISGARLGLAALPAELVSRLNDHGEWRAPDLLELARGCAAIAKDQ